MAQEQTEPKVILERIKSTAVARISIQNPPFNQLSGEVLLLLGEFLKKVKEDERTKVLIIGREGMFSAGADVNEIWAIAQEGSVEKALESLDQANAIPNAIENLGKPTIAVIDGYCLGGGNELAMSCTYRLASEDSKFGQPEIKHGIMPGMGGTQRLPRLINITTALDMLISGDFVPANEALESGLVDEVVKLTELGSRAIVIAQSLIETHQQRKPRVMDLKLFDQFVSSSLFKTRAENKSPEAVQYILTAVKCGMCLPLQEALKLEQKLFAELVMTDSAKKGLSKIAGRGRDSKCARFLLPSDKLPENVFTVNDLNEEQRLVRDSIREVVRDNLASPETSARIESKDFPFSRELMRKFAEVGLLGVEVPEEYGGVNLGTVVSAIVAEEVYVQGSFACTFLAHTGIGTLPIRFFGTDEQKRKYLPKLTSGEWISAYSLTEGSAGSDANGVKTVARLSDDGRCYILNGEKIFVTNGGLADLFIIFAKIDGKDLTAFIVEKNSEGLKVGKEEHKMGIQGSSTTAILLDSVKVPVENLLGERGKGFKIAVNILNLGRFKLGAACLGGGRMYLNESLKHSAERKQFGLPIFKFGAIRRKLAEMAAKNYAMEAIVYRTAGLLQEAIHSVDQNDPQAVLKAIEDFAVECSLVKVFCSEASDFIVDENVQIHGGSGYCEEMPPARHYRDSRINRIFEGTNEVNRLVAIGMVLKKIAMGTLPLLSSDAGISQDWDPAEIATKSQDPVGSLHLCLNHAKTYTLDSIRMAWNKFAAPKLGELEKEVIKHQMVFMNLADCLMIVYVLDSVLAALVKNQTDKNLWLARLVFNENLHKLRHLTEEIAGMCSGTTENVEDICNNIADSLLGA